MHEIGSTSTRRLLDFNDIQVHPGVSSQTPYTSARTWIHTGSFNSFNVPICQDHLRNFQVLPMDDCYRRNLAIATREKRRTTNAVFS
jgi:hypothetical protein